MPVSSPTLIRDGLYGATFTHNNETLHLRMELITEQNADSWGKYCHMSAAMANNTRDIFGSLVAMAGTDKYPSYSKEAGSEYQELIGLSKKEYTKFAKEAIELKKKNDKIVSILKSNSAGSWHTIAFYDKTAKNDQRFAVYVTKNKDFSFKTLDVSGKVENLKNYIDLFSNILISVGTCFKGKGTAKNVFENRGIHRNPYWVFKQRYAGLSMLLHSFTGAVAEKYYPAKKLLHIRPAPSMSAILKKSLLPGDGYIEKDGNRQDITQMDDTAGDPPAYIHRAALNRLYLAATTAKGRQLRRKLPEKVAEVVEEKVRKRPELRKARS